MMRATMSGPVGEGVRPSRSDGPGSRRVRVGVVGTFPPRLCGLATFTADVAESLHGAGATVVVVALVDTASSSAPDAAYRLVQSSEVSARSVAASLSADVDVVLIEHEFGIFGGEGSAVLQAFTDTLTVPYVVTLHTVLEPFLPWQVAALAAPLAGAARVFVFSDEAVGLLAAQFVGVGERCVVVPHAAPVALFSPEAVSLREQLGVPDSTMVIATFGLLSPSKGIEHVITAMAAVRERVDGVVYLIAGRTHPEVVRHSGERYRRGLEELARSLGVADVVRFRDWFHDIDELAVLLHGTDVFVTPYSGAEQIVSGALSFAVAAGVPFVSTPYRYATGLAARGCGITVPFDDDDALGDALAEVLEDHDRRHHMAACAKAVSAERSWPVVGQRITALLAEVVDERGAERRLDGPVAETPAGLAVA
jgi:glycosyltransferase involved in cell wall biosynthesis